MRMIEKYTLCLAVLLAIVVLIVQPAQARLKYDPNNEVSNWAQLQMPKPTAGTPYTSLRVHNVGNFYLSVTNWGFFGSQAGEFKDPKTGLPAPGAHFPAGSNIDYLFQGALWISALVGNDTLTSVGHDGWLNTSEMFPETFENGGDLIERSTRPGSEFFSEDAVSEQDFVAVYTDTLTDQQFVTADQYTGPHVPLFIKITQKSYSWSYSYAQDFILLDFTLENIGVDTIRSMYMGLYIDADVYHFTRRADGFSDDICGFRAATPNPSGSKLCRSDEALLDTINIAWIADNDGDPVGGIFDYRSPKAVTGTRVIRSPSPPGQCGPTPLDYSFNWWISNGNTMYDWSPQHMPGDMNVSGGFGTPDGDPHKYRYMSNGEFDYDQIYSVIEFEGWIPPSRQANTLADGYDTRYLLSFGPFDLGPDSSLPVTVAYVAGDDFHTSPDNGRFLPGDPDEFYRNLDFTDLAVNAQWAAWVFDNPGVDSDDDGCFGLYYLVNCDIDTVEGVASCVDCDTVWYAGDGIPDYAGPPPPQSPELHISTEQGKVVIEWDGRGTELNVDPFSFLNDFEGYRVYLADLDRVANFSLVASWDRVDFRPYREDVTQAIGSPGRWDYREYPLTLEELREKFNDPDFDPLLYTSPLDAYTDTAGGGVRYYFEKEDWNRGNTYPEKNFQNRIERVGVEMMVDESTGDTLYYGRYRFEIEGLLPSQPYYFAVTAFDYGYPQNGLEPLESSPLVNSQLAYPIFSSDLVEESALEVTVYPNPYKISDDYRGRQYEDRDRAGWSERSRRIYFAHLPERATITIYTLDGDMVRQIRHEPGGNFTEFSSLAYWDLISRNTQAIVSGIYLYSVEPDDPSVAMTIGKLVIIK